MRVFQKILTLNMLQIKEVWVRNKRCATAPDIKCKLGLFEAHTLDIKYESLAWV